MYIYRTLAADVSFLQRGQNSLRPEGSFCLSNVMAQLQLNSKYKGSVTT